MPRAPSAMRCAPRGSTSGSTRARCAAATRGMRRSASQIKECALFVPVISANTQAREEGYFRREWNLAVSRTLDMADDKAFLLPVVIDATLDVSARVPEKFREVQWTHLPAGEASAAFAERVQRLLVGAAPARRTARRRVTAAAPRRRRHSCTRRRSAVDRGAAVRQHEPRRGERVLRRRAVGRAPQRAGEDPRPARRVAHLGVLVQGQGRRHRDDRAEAQCRARARRQRAQVRQARAHHGAADRGRVGFAPLVGDLRPRARRHLRGAGRHRAVGGQGAPRGADGGSRLRARPAQSAAADVRQAAAGRSDNPEAFQLYLQGKFFGERTTQADTDKAIGLFKQALALDPTSRWRGPGCAHVHQIQAGFGFAPDRRGLRASARGCASGTGASRRIWPRATSSSGSSGEPRLGLDRGRTRRSGARWSSRPAMPTRSTRRPAWRGFSGQLR